MSSAQKKISGKRFKTGIEFEKQLTELTRAIQDRILNNLPSNYPRDRNTNIAEFFRAIAKEFARLQTSASDINEDKYHDSTRVEYLHQILGDTLFLGNKAINEELADTEYRDFLLKVRNAYYGGSRPDNIETAVSDILGVPVELKELYLKLREENTSVTLKDTHTMYFDILMDEADPSSDVGLLLQDIRFFIDLIKPAHVKYDTRLIWSDSFLNREGNCEPIYDTVEMEEVFYNAVKIHMVTYLLSELYRFDGEEPEGDYESGTISYIDTVNKIIRTTDSRILAYVDETEFFRYDGIEWVSITPSILIVGNEIRYAGTKDAAGTSSVIDDTWEFSGTITDILEDEEYILLSDGSKIVYNSETLVYTRDGVGEYRITVDDLLLGYEIAYKGQKFTEDFQFYIEPEEVQENPYKRFDNLVIEKPFFQEHVKKVKDLGDGLIEGPQVVIVDGIATVKDLKPRFYKRKDQVNYKESSINRYSLYIDGVYQIQFSLTDPSRKLTQSESKQIFVDVYGYTELNDPTTDYSIEISTTGRWVSVP